MIVYVTANIGTRHIIEETHYRENSAAAFELSKQIANHFYDYFNKEDIEISYTPAPFHLRIDSRQTAKFLLIATV